MTEPQPAKHVPRNRKDIRKRNASTPMIIAGFVVVAIIGYMAGAFNVSLMNGGWARLRGVDAIDLSSVEETYYALAQNFDGELDVKTLIEGANRGLVDAAGDQYTVFMNAEENGAFNDDLSGNIGAGVGIEVGIQNNHPTVLRVLQGNPAEKAGVMVADVIYKVNDEVVIDLTVSEVVEKIRGEEDTSVKLTVIRTGLEKDFSITRQQVNNPSAYGEVVDGVGVLTITRFDDNTGSLSRAIAQDFKDKNVKGVVLDLRGNGGGYVTAAQAVAGIWLDNEIVVTERQGGQVVDDIKTGDNPILDGTPTVVLVNASSASASEIVAGALRDHKKASLFGTTTFGKGSVQKLVNLSNGALLKVTTARWYTPAGVNISETGIEPDTIVERTADDINAGRDPQLDAAVSSF